MKCPLCGLDSTTLPHRARDEMGVSCKRCGDFYIDGMLVCKEPPADAEARAVVSGHTKWAKILGKPPVEITVNNFDEIVISHRRLSHLDKVDLLLQFYLIKEPRPGHYINFDEKLEIPIIYSADDKEFMYLISDLAHKKLGYLDYVARETIRITPRGWERIDMLQRIQLANDKIELISLKIDKDTNLSIANAKEKAGVRGTRHSSALARQIRDILLESIKLKLEKKLEIDKEVIIGAEVVSNLDNINFLSERIRSFWEEKKGSVLNNLKDHYEDCHGMSHYESAKDEFLKDAGREVRLLQIDLKTGESRTDKELAEGKKLTDRIEAPDPKRVLVVYGRNEKARRAIFELLRAVDLKPFEWGEAVKKTRKGSPYVGEILDEAFRDAQAVIVLLTGDDIAHLREEYIKPNDTEHEGRPSLQARTNVIFEAGRAFGTHPDRTILVELEKERTKPFSDIGGRHVLRISNQAERRKELVDRLKTAGCDVCIDDRTDWMSAGDFDGAALGWLSSTPKQPDQIRGERQARKPEFNRELGTTNITGFSKKQVWTATTAVLKAEKIEVMKTSESWIFARQTTGDKVEVDIGIVDHPEHDDLRPWAPAVSLGIDVPILGELGDNRTWTTEQRHALSHEIYEKITDVLYGVPAR